MAFAGSAVSKEQFPRDGLPEVAFLGRSNVGKSSLLNALAGTNLARVSGQPGRTQTLNFFRLERSGAGRGIYFVDLPGYGYAKVPRSTRLGFKRLVEGYLGERDPLALCVFLVDARHEPMPGDVTLREYLEIRGLPYVLVATKSDKLGRGELARRRRALASGLGAGARAVLSVSALTRAGVPELWQQIQAATAGPS